MTDTTTISRRAAFLHSPELEQYAYPPDCPFSTARAGITRGIITSMGLLDGPDRREVAPVPATRETLEHFHAPVYLDALQAAGDPLTSHLSPLTLLKMGLGTPDTPIFPGMYDYAALATGATLTAARLLLAGEAYVAFNPSGGYHHAGADYASGFCYLNDVALGCGELAAAGRRVLYLDIDVHHGDGVQRAFYRRADVMTISFHESGTTLFPGTGFPEEIGEGPGRGYAVNIPLPPYTYDEAFLGAFREIVPPLMQAFAPQIVVLEVGMDGLAGDPLAHLQLTNNAHAEVVRWVAASGVPVLMTGGGGYNIQKAARGWALAWSVLIGAEDAADLVAGMGGVMLMNTDWQAGLRDRPLFPAQNVREQVERAVRNTVETVKAQIFPYHGL